MASLEGDDGRVKTIIGKLQQKAYLAMLILGLGLLEVLAGFMLVNIAADRTVTATADHYGTSWAEFLSRNMADLEPLLNGETPSVETDHLLGAGKPPRRAARISPFRQGRQTAPGLQRDGRCPEL